MIRGIEILLVFESYSVGFSRWIAFDLARTGNVQRLCEQLCMTATPQRHLDGSAVLQTL
jgi:hypothetical protein